MSWIVTLKIVDCATTSTLLSGVRIYSPLLNTLGNSVYTDSNGEAQIYDAYDQWEWVNLTISNAGYIAKNFVINMSMDGTVQTVCLNREPVPDPNAPPPTGPSCFIVTATTGSPDSAELIALRALRDRISTVSTLGSTLIDEIYREYAQFSPAIANELTTDDTTRTMVLDIVVRPLLAWYTLAGDLGLNPDTHNHDTAARNVTAACPTQYTDLMTGLLHPDHHTTPPTDLNHLIPHAGDYPLAAWAILDPLTRAWRSATEHLDVTDQVAQWLASVPLEALDLPTDPDTYQHELDTLTGFLRFNPHHQQRLHERLTSTRGVTGAG